MIPILIVISACLAGSCYGQGSSGALAFSGSSYLSIGNSVSVRPSTALTLEAWVYVTNHLGTDRRMLISKDDDWNPATSGYHMWIEGGSGTPVFGVGNNVVNGTYVAGADPFPLNGWHHLAGTFVAGTLQLYLDGVLIASSNSAPATIGYSTDELRIGRLSAAFSTYNYFFDGRIDEIRIWNRALTEAEIRHKMTERLTGTEPGLAAYWRMDEGTDNTCPGGQDVCDASGNGNHGTKF